MARTFSTGRRVLGLFFAPCLIIFISLATQTAGDRERIAVAYASSFEAFTSLQFEWDGVLPSFDALVELLSEPAAALARISETIANMGSYLEYRPSYFVDGMQATTALNWVLIFVKLLATYGRKVFATVDYAKALLRSWGGYEAASDGNDGTVQVYEAVTSLEAVKVMDLVGKADPENKSLASLLKQTELKWCGKNLDDDDMEAFALLLAREDAQAHYEAEVD